jgi:hypothetical protein
VRSLGILGRGRIGLIRAWDVAVQVAKGRASRKRVEFSGDAEAQRPDRPVPDRPAPAPEGLNRRATLTQQAPEIAAKFSQN